MAAILFQDDRNSSLVNRGSTWFSFLRYEFWKPRNKFGIFWTLNVLHYVSKSIEPFNVTHRYTHDYFVMFSTLIGLACEVTIKESKFYYQKRECRFAEYTLLLNCFWYFVQNFSTTIFVSEGTTKRRSMHEAGFFCTILDNPCIILVCAGYSLKCISWQFLSDCCIWHFVGCKRHSHFNLGKF